MSSNLIVELTLLGLILLSIGTWSITTLKYRSFREDKNVSCEFLANFWAERGWEPRFRAAENGKGDFAKLAQVGYTTCHELAQELISYQNTEQGNSKQEQDEVLERQLRKALQAMNRRRERGLAELASIGSTSPFIGLFGTVWGIMNALKTITATGNASIDVVAGPIGEALIATAVGIATAIPAVLMYNYFLRHQKVHVTELDGFLDDFLRHAMRNRSSWGRTC